jgi:E1A-binding protein p400
VNGLTNDFIQKALQVIMELPLSLQVIAPGHQPNWDLISDLVSTSYTGYFRSSADCRKRFENVIMKREELCLNELHNKKQQQQQAKDAAAAVPVNKYKQPAKPAVRKKEK